MCVGYLFAQLFLRSQEQYPFAACCLNVTRMLVCHLKLEVEPILVCPCCGAKVQTLPPACVSCWAIDTPIALPQISHVAATRKRLGNFSRMLTRDSDAFFG